MKYWKSSQALTNEWNPQLLGNFSFGNDDTGLLFKSIAGSSNFFSKHGGGDERKEPAKRKSFFF